MKKLFYYIKWLPSKLKNKFTFKLRSVSIGNNLKTHGTIFVRGNGKISIGDNVVINSCLESNPIGGDSKTIFFIKKNAKLDIGNNVGISNSAFYSESAITVEDDVFIGNGCKIYDSNFHSLNYEDRKSHNEIPVTKPVIIKKGAFVGAHSIVLKGVTIGEKSIIGAGSVVSKSVPDGEIWAGNPAKLVRKV